VARIQAAPPSKMTHSCPTSSSARLANELKEEPEEERAPACPSKALSIFSLSIYRSDSVQSWMATTSKLETSSVTAPRAPHSQPDTEARVPRPDSAELQWFDRYSHLMVVLACTLVGYVFACGGIGQYIHNMLH
jgi:hypothetical protein